MFRKVSQRTSMNSSDRGGSRSSDAPDSRSQTLNHPVQLRIDVPLLLTVAVLLIFGLLMVYSASYDPSYRFNEGKPFVIIQRQFLFMIVGIVIAVGIAFFNYHLWQRLAVPLMAITVISLIAVLFRGQSAAGVQRSLVGNSVQPSELAKFVIIIYLSVWLYAKREQLHQVSFGLIPLAVMLGILGGLIAQQPDLSALVTVIFLGGLMFFLAGGDLKQIAVLGVVALVARKTTIRT